MASFYIPGIGDIRPPYRGYMSSMAGMYVLGSEDIKYSLLLAGYLPVDLQLTRPKDAPPPPPAGKPVNEILFKILL